jgi:transcriptional regulator with GAF, ATPase, and Fis domain
MDDNAVEGELVAVLSRLQTLLISHPVAGAAVQQLAEITGHLVPHATAASASLLGADGTTISTAATSPLADHADAAQFDLDEGPALDTWATQTIQRLEDTATDTRWPAFSHTMLNDGLRCALCAPLIVHGQALGVVKVYATTPGAFTVTDERILGLLASVAAALLTGDQHPQDPPRLNAALHAALEQRHVMDLATGMLMERHHLETEAARRRLEDTAAAQHRRPAALARQLVHRGGDSCP